MREIDFTTIACEYCGVPKGEDCKTSGGTTVRPHSDRTRPLSEAWRVGYRAGQEDLRMWLKKGFRP